MLDTFDDSLFNEDGPLSNLPYIPSNTTPIVSSSSKQNVDINFKVYEQGDPEALSPLYHIMANKNQPKKPDEPRGLINETILDSLIVIFATKAYDEVVGMKNQFDEKVRYEMIYDKADVVNPDVVIPEEDFVEEDSLEYANEEILLTQEGTIGEAIELNESQLLVKTLETINNDNKIHLNRKGSKRYDKYYLLFLFHGPASEDSSQIFNVLRVNDKEFNISVIPKKPIVNKFNKIVRKNGRTQEDDVISVDSDNPIRTKTDSYTKQFSLKHIKGDQKPKDVVALESANTYLRELVSLAETPEEADVFKGKIRSNLLQLAEIVLSSIPPTSSNRFQTPTDPPAAIAPLTRKRGSNDVIDITPTPAGKKSNSSSSVLVKCISCNGEVLKRELFCEYCHKDVCNVNCFIFTDETRANTIATGTCMSETCQDKYFLQTNREL